MNIHRLRKELQTLESRYAEKLKTWDFAGASAMMVRIEEIKAAVKVYEYTRSQPLRQLLEEDHINADTAVFMAIKMHLAADYLAHCAYDLHDYLKSKGLELKDVLANCKKVADESNKMANEIINKSEKFENLIVDDDVLIEAIDKKVASYIQQRVKSKKNDSKRIDRAAVVDA